MYKAILQSWACLHFLPMFGMRNICYHLRSFLLRVSTDIIPIAIPYRSRDNNPRSYCSAFKLPKTGGGAVFWFTKSSGLSPTTLCNDRNYFYCMNSVSRWRRIKTIPKLLSILVMRTLVSNISVPIMATWLLDRYPPHF